MKKLTSMILTLALLLALCACNGGMTAEPPTGDGAGGAEQNGGGAADTLPDGGDTTPDTPSGEESKPTRPSGNASLADVDNGVLERTSLSSMAVPENMKLIGTADATEENNSASITATAVLYALDGDVVNWRTENDFLYVITKGNNRLVVIDAISMCPVYNVPLAGIPAEINLVGDTVCISLPDLCRIDVFAKSDCTRFESLYFDHEVSSFCFDGDFIFYSEHDQHCRVFRKHLITEELTKLTQGNTDTFYMPKLYVNREDRILYIGETGHSSSALFYYNADTSEEIGVFRKNDYGIINHTREIIHIGDDIFWGSFRLSDVSPKQIIGKYGTADYGSVTFASHDLVATYEGLFLTDTYECVIKRSDTGFPFEYVLVSESYHVFFRQRTFDKNIILGINFALQETKNPAEGAPPTGLT